MLSVNIISGFLGAGKTTLLMRILRKGIPGERVAVIVNEFGQVGVDGEIIGRGGYEMVELASGCICCTLQTDLYNAVRRMMDELNPDRLIIEATGIARPADIVKALRWEPLNYLARVETIVDIIDVSRFQTFRERMGEFYEDQASAADLILLNKRDLSDEGTLQSVMRQVRELNPKALIVPTEQCALELSLVLSRTAPHPSSDGRTPPQTYHHEEGAHEDHHEAEEDFETFTYEAQGRMDRESFIRFLRALPEGVIRLKGFVRFDDGAWLLNYSSGDYTLEPAGAREETKLVFIGKDMDRALITRTLDEARAK